jgi:hypothetical protein
LFGGAPIYIKADGGIEMNPAQNVITLTSSIWLPKEVPFVPPPISGKLYITYYLFKLAFR